jgi:hypothetical protein
MKYSPPNDQKRDGGMRPAPLTEATGWHPVLPVPADPIGAWIDLMDVVEMLCPVWSSNCLPPGPDFRL